MTTTLTTTGAFRTLSRLVRTPSAVQKRWTHDGFASLNIYKDPTRAPKEMEDKDYPDWLWRILDTEPTKEELLRAVERHYAQGGYDAVFDNMCEKDLTRLFRLDQRERIKENNDRRRGGKVV